jgi:electron transfer flavoprotein beta subunit
MLAECLGIQSVSGVSALQIENGRVLMTREIDGGKELVSTPTPVVAIVQKGIAKEPRIPSMRGIMTARTKPIKVVEPVAFETMTGILAFELPPPRAACKFVDPENPKLLVELLQNEAKLI